MKLKSIPQLRKEYPNLENETDDQVADRYYEFVNYDRGKMGEDPLDYYVFTKYVNPTSPDVNFQVYKDNLDPEILKSKSDAEHAYDVFKRLKEEKNIIFGARQFLDDYAPKTEEKAISGSGQYGPIKTEIVNVPYSPGEIADLSGVAKDDPDFPAFKARAVASTGIDEKNLVQGLKNVGSQYFGEDVEVRKGPDTGELEIFNPKLGKFMLINKPGLDAGDFGAAVSDTGIAVGEALGTIAGGLTGSLVGPKGAAVGAVGGGALGAMAGDMARIYVGHQYFGLNPDVEGFSDYLNETMATGGISAAAGTLFAVPGMIKLLAKGSKKMTEGFNEKDFEAFVGSAEEAKQLADNVNKKIADNKLRGELKFTLGQATNDPELLAWQNAFEKSSKYGVKGDFHQLNKNNALALKELFELYRDGFVAKNLTGKNPDGFDTVMKKMQDKALELNSAKRKPLVDALESSSNDLTDAVLQFPDGTIKEGGISIKSAITEFQDMRRNEIAKMYEELFKGVDKGGADGLALRKVGVEQLRETVDSLSARAKDTLLKDYPSMSGILKLPKKDEKINFQTLHNTRSDLLRLKRDLEAKKISAENTPSEQQINQLVKAINKQMDTSLGKNDVGLAKYRAIDEEAKNFYDYYNRFVGKLVQKNGGRLNIGDEDIFKTTFKTGKTQQSRIDDVYDVLKTNPEAMDLYKNNINEFYMQIVDPKKEGKIDLNKHKKFIQDYKYGLEKIFGKDGYKDISRVGGLQKKLDDIEVKNKNLIAQLNKTTEGQILNKDPEDIFKFAFQGNEFGGAKPTKLREVMEIIKDDELLENEFKTLVTQKMMLDTTNPTDFSFNGKAFNKFIKENKQNLNIVFKDNPQYLKDIDEFNKVLSILDRRSPDAVPQRFQSALRDLIRSRVGMFTVAGRTMTAGIKISEDMLNRKLAEIIQNPDELRKLIDLEKKKPKFLDTATGKQLVYDLFGSIPAMQYFDVTPDAEDASYLDIYEVEKSGPSIEIKEEEVKPQSQVDSPSVDMFAMEQMPRPTEPAPIAPPPVQQPQPAGIAALPADRGQTYAGLFPNDPSGQMIAQRGTPNART